MFTGVFVKDGKYVLFYEKFYMSANLNALIFDEKDFKELKIIENILRGILGEGRRYISPAG
jgi:hypothetical protein